MTDPVSDGEAATVAEARAMLANGGNTAVRLPDGIVLTTCDRLEKVTGGEIPQWMGDRISAFIRDNHVSS